MNETYLYGDSTHSPLTVDLVGLLPDVVAFCVLALRSDDRIERAIRHLSEVSAAIDEELSGAQRLVADALQLLDPVASAPDGRMAHLCATLLRQAANDALASVTAAGQAKLASEAQKADELAAVERRTVASAFDDLLLCHSLPDTSEVIEVHFEDERYRATLFSTTSFGLSWATTLRVPAGHALASALRLDRVMDPIEIEAATPRKGWLRRQPTIRMQRLDRLYLTELRVTPDAAVVGLRATPSGAAAGFDLAFQAKTESVQVAHVAAGGATESSYDIDLNDSRALRDFRDRLGTMAGGLCANKGSVEAATLDGVALVELEAPRVLVARIVACLAPFVQEVGKRSTSSEELVLKRQVADHHREEIFVSKASLRAKLDELEPALRQVFDALELGERVSHVQPIPSQSRAVHPVTVPPAKVGQSLTHTMPFAFTGPDGALDGQPPPGTDSARALADP